MGSETRQKGKVTGTDTLSVVPPPTGSTHLRRRTPFSYLLIPRATGSHPAISDAFEPTNLVSIVLYTRPK